MNNLGTIVLFSLPFLIAGACWHYLTRKPKDITLYPSTGFVWIAMGGENRAWRAFYRYNNQGEVLFMGSEYSRDDQDYKEYMQEIPDPWIRSRCLDDYYDH